MENVFALTSMEKGVGRGWNGPRLQRGCGKGWTLAPTRCPSDMLARPYGFCASRGGRRRYNKNERSFLRSGKVWRREARTRPFIVSFPGGWGKSRRESRCWPANGWHRISFRSASVDATIARIVENSFGRVYLRLDARVRVESVLNPSETSIFKGLLEGLIEE